MNKMPATFKTCLSFGVLMLLFCPAPAPAQDDAPAAPENRSVEMVIEELEAPEDTDLKADFEEPSAEFLDATSPAEDITEVLPQPPVEGYPVQDIPSLIFTYWEHTALLDAREAAGKVNPQPARIVKDGGQQEEKPKPPPEKREIRLGGILYNGPQDWTIWLNEQRVTPETVPKEVVDLSVSKDYIELKWYDDYTELIYPIRLRPHQRFNVDTRIFLPG